MHAEQRRNPRFPVGARVLISLHNGTRVAGQVWDMSTSGMFVVTKERPYGLFPGEPGAVFLEHDPELPPEGDTRFPCEIIRVDGDGLAVEFLFDEQ